MNFEKELCGLPKHYKLLLDENMIKNIVNKCANTIHNHFASNITNSSDKCEIVLLRVLKGGSYFATDLARNLRNIIRVCKTYKQITLTDEYITASSYRGSQVAGDLVIKSELDISKLQGKKVILVDELIDVGETLSRLHSHFIESGFDPADLFTLVAFMKNKSRVLEPTWHGIVVPDVWLIGYGLDDVQEYRELECLCYVGKPEGIEKTSDDHKYCVENYHEAVLEYYHTVKATLMN